MIFRSFDEQANQRQEMCAQGKRKTMSLNCNYGRHGRCENAVCCCICHVSRHAEERESAHQSHRQRIHGLMSRLGR